MQTSDFYKSIGHLVGPEKLNALLIETDQQSGRNQKMISPICKAFGSDAADQISDMLDTVFASGFLQGLERGIASTQGESNEGSV